MNTNSEWHTRRTLLKKIRDQHDDHAWSDFVFYYRSYIYNIIRRMGLNHHDAEEVVQQVVMKAWKQLPDFDYDPNKGRFRGWLCSITGGTTKDFLRKKKDHFVSLEAAVAEGESSFSEPVTMPEIEKIADEEWEKYLPELAWKNVEKEFEDNVKNTYYLLKKGKTPKEITAELDLAENTVYVYKKRVVDRLRQEIIHLKRELE